MFKLGETLRINKKYIHYEYINDKLSFKTEIKLILLPSKDVWQVIRKDIEIKERICVTKKVIIEKGTKEKCIKTYKNTIQRMLS